MLTMQLSKSRKSSGKVLKIAIGKTSNLYD